jgi:hypothetical protein
MEGEKHLTFTEEVAPPTSLWKLSFVVWMMVLNTLFQAVLASMMWVCDRINRPTWSTGTFIGLGCGVSLLAGLVLFCFSFLILLWEPRTFRHGLRAAYSD